MPPAHHRARRQHRVRRALPSSRWSARWSDVRWAIEAASGLMSYGEIIARLDAALADPQVAGILLDLDSPGGEASGVFELAERIRAASTIKPIWAHANDAAYSAAYAIAAACQRL